MRRGYWVVLFISWMFCLSYSFFLRIIAIYGPGVDYVRSKIDYIPVFLCILVNIWISIRFFHASRSQPVGSMYIILNLFLSISIYAYSFFLLRPGHIG